MDISEQCKFALTRLTWYDALVTNANAVQSIFKEALNLKKLRHKNIIELYNTFVEKKQMIMIMEYAGGGELLGYLQKIGTMGEVETRHIICQIINCINYCHTRGIVHRDLKLENVIFRDPIESEKPDLQELFVKVIDFGIAGVCETGKNDKGDAGSLCYMAPECLKGKAAESNPAIDVWAIGIMFFSLLQGTLPFYSSDEETTVKLIKTAPIKFDKNIPVTPMSREIITKMLDRDPSTRLDLMDLMDHEFFTMEDEEYKKMVDTFVEEFHRAKEEQKTQELLSPPVSKGYRATSPHGKKGSSTNLKKDANSSAPGK